MNSLTILVEHEFGDIVYLKTDEESLPRIVLEYLITPTLNVIYKLQHAANETSNHYAFEITKEKSVIIS